MSAIYSRRNSAQSYSSNIETGDSFQLYGRRFGNTYEASQIYDLLKLRVALLPGGKDSKQGPIIIFPSDSGIHRVSERDVIDCLIYLGSIPSEASAKKCFSIIIDNQKKTLSTQVNFILSCCQKSFDNAVSDIYIIEEPPILNLDLNRNISSAKIHVVTKSQLQNSFNARHLLPNLGGTLNYSHEKWLMFRKFIESYTKEAKSVCSELDMFAVHMSSNLFQATPSNLQNLWIDYMDVKRRAEEFVRKGDEFCISFKSPTFETFEEDEMIVLRRASSAMTEVEGKLSTLDVMWRRKDVEEQQKAGITSLEKEMNEVVEWILGPGDKLLISQTGIGRSYDSADELRKQHERLELKCLDSYGRYAELRHKVEAYAQYSLAEESKATELEAQRDYMDTVYRSFAKRLEQRRNTVIAAVKFHRLIDEISVLLEEIRKRLNYKTDLDSVEELLDTLNALSEKLDFNHSMVMREGGLLKDMLCLPLKNAYGQDVNINREPDITYVENCLEKLQNDRENIRDALELKKLELQQFLQLKICEQNIEQAIAWIKELDGLINDPDSQNNQTLKDLERFQEELGKGENTAKNSFDYGQELLKAALYLRRALGLDMEPNSDQANRLNEAWRNFSRGSNENAARRTAVAIFDKKSDEFLKATENLLANLDVSAPQSYEEEKRNLDQHHRELQMTADGLNERIQRPILFEQNNRNQPNMDNLQVAENIKIKIQRMNDRMDQLNRKWSSLSKNGYVAGQRDAYEGSDLSGNSQSRGIELRSMGTRREVYDGNMELNGLVRPAPQNQLNDWLESHALRRITSTNNMGSTLESVEDFYEKHVESLQDMKAQEHVHKAGLNKNLPQQWNVVQEIIKQRITLALSLIKFHLSFNKASEDLERVERWIDGKSDVNINGALTELEENEDTMARNAAEFLNSASNQVHKDEYLNVDQPKYFVRDIMDQWKQRKGQVERGLLARSMEDLLHEANSINEELNNLENDFLKSPSAPSRNISEFNNRMEDLSKRISSLEDYYNLEQKSPFIDPSHSSEVQSKLEDLRSKCSNLKRLFQQNSHVDTFKKDFLTSENLPQNEFYVVRPLQDAVARKGESLKLSCYINASPAQKIRVKWLKDGSVLNCSGVKYDSQYKDGRCDLTISDVSQEDSGRYSCVAADGQVAISTADVLVEAAPSIKEPLRDKVIKEGEPVEFSIKVAGNPIPTVQWFLNGKELSNSPDFQIFSKDDVHTLRISEVFDEDKGLYSVLAKNKYGETTDRARLKVSVSPSADDSTSKHVRTSNWNPSPATSSFNASAQPSLKNATPFESRPNSGFLKPLADKTSEAGEDIILECNLPLFPVPSKITWYKDGIEITRTMPGIRTSMQQGICRLVIERADTSHSGKYVCKAQLKENLYETSMLLTVRDKLPMMLPDSKYSPSATLNTKKTDAPSKFDTSFQVAPFESSLRSQDFQGKSTDGGLGFSVRNSAAPQFVKKLESSLLVENSSTTFSCKVTGEPAPNIQWYHNGRLIRPSNKYRMKLNKDGECSLMVTDCNKQDAGFYTCCALNVTGRDVCSAELMSEGANDIDTTSYVEPDALKRMLRPKSSTKTEEVYAGVVESLSEPSFAKSCVTQVTVDEGETARIECKVYGHPSPDLSWYKNGKEVRRGGRFQVVTNQEGMQSLVIKLVQCSDAGVYTCRAHNKSGQATMDFTLQVEDVSSKYQSKIYLSRNAPSVKQAEVVPPPQSPPGYTPLSKVFSDSTKLKMSSKQAEVQRSVENELSLQRLPPVRNNSSPKPLDHFPPRFLVTPDPVTANEGGYAKFWAKVSANPPATVTWFINGHEIFTSSRFNVYFDGLMHVLEIMKVKNFDDGEVKVAARNYKGDVQHAVQLSVADAISLRTHLHPSTDALQSKKRSLPSIEITSTKGGSYSGFVKKDVPSDSTKEVEQETVKLPLKDVKKTHPENGELKGNESYVSSHGIDFKDQKSESSFDSARFKKDLKSPDPPLSLRDSLNQEIIWRGKADKEKLKPDVPGEVGAKEFKELDKSEPFQSSDSKLITSEIKSYTRFGIDDKSRKVSDEVDHKSVENQDTKDGATRMFDGSGQSADEKQETLSKKVRTEVTEFTTSTHKDVLQDSQTERSRTPAKDDIRNKSPEEFSLGKKIKSSEADGSRSQNESSFFQKSMKSTTTTETTEYKWKQFLEGSEEDSESNIGETDKGSPSLESSETFYRKEESDHKSIEESRQKLHLKSEMNQKSRDLMPKDTVYSKTKDGRAKEDDKKDYKIESSLDTGDKSHLKDVHVDIKYRATVSDDVKNNDHVKPRIKEENLHGVDAGNVGGPVAGISKYQTSEEQKDAPRDGEDEPVSSTSEEERAREQKYISTLTEEITFKDVNNVPQKFSTRLLKTVEYTKTNSIKSSTKDMPDLVEEDSRSKPPYVRHAMSEFQWNIQDSEDQSNLRDIGDQYKKWREDASAEISDNNHQIYSQDSQPVPNQNEYSLNEYGEYYTSNSIRNEKKPENVKYLSSYIDKASGNHLEISNKGVQYDSNGKIATREAVFSEPVEKSVTIQDVETTDEITVETKVTQVKTVSMQLSETGDINLTETTQVQTDTDMKETKKTREREELVVSHLVSNVTEVLDQGDPNASNVNLQEEQNAEAVSEKYDLFSTWNIEPGVLIAVHSYEPDSDEVMSLHEGERLEFLEENSEDWWFVRKFFDNRQGFVPSRLLQTKEDFDKNVSDKIAQQIDRLEDSLSTKLEDYGQESPPHMVNLLEDVSVRDGESATFKCLVSGNPKPSITWFHNSKIVKPSPDFLQFYDPDYVCSLSIREVFPEDGGRYTMIAKNLFGIASSSAELLVVENEYIREKEETKVSGCPILVVQPKHLVLNEGSTAKFTCKFKGKFPMKVTWYKDGRQVSPGDKTKFDVTEEDGEFITVELTLESVVESHMGKYRVLVSNELGETEALTSLVINVLPKTIDFKANLKKSSREPDTNVTFKQERVLEEKSQQERLHSHTEANSSFGSSEVIQHDFRNVLKPSSSTNTRY